MNGEREVKMPDSILQLAIAGRKISENERLHPRLDPVTSSALPKKDADYDNIF